MSAFDWMDDALCAQTDPEIFHPDGSGVGYSQARKICAACPVQRECRQYADRLEAEEARRDRHGMWGATTPAKRASRRTNAA